ncbi:DUF6951 family protein [Methanolobus halotolerans]|uniref:Uncharacterized protein n=1 Tax=Methanolobus halotolerans TaxID=2052935 RepID=A0A4E0PYN3_9EURY|nr:hypothetical protein [Methanolobus halotolerans]TGC10649.1 hypothetical protein CUN85_03960 [Methanolobus halotolerans]
MSQVIINSKICGFVHKVNGKRKGQNIIIDIETDCEKIKGMSHMEIPMDQTLDIRDNYVILKAQEMKCSSNCLVPCGVLHICRIEMGILSESLAKKSGSISIDFK